MMNKRQIILDFTSLLDVVMIILFFFILFSHFQTIEEKEALQQAQQEAAMREEEAAGLKYDLDKLLADAEKKEQLADEKLKEAELAGERNGENVEGITEFGKNRNIKIKLKMIDGSNNWCLDIYKGDDKVSTVSKSSVSVMSEELITALSDIGCEKDDTLLCVFVYNASERGTNSAFDDVSGIFGELKKQYRHFYYCEIDNSLFTEE